MSILIYAFAFLFGTIIGSFINCLVWRVHEKEGIGGRSYCPRCRAPIAWYDNIPVLSYLILRARCRHCQMRISIQYPLVELAAGLLFLLAWHMNCDPQSAACDPGLIKYWFIISASIALFVFDLRWYILPDIITLPSAAAVFLLNILLGFDLWILLISGIIGAGFFLLQFLVSRGKWIGGGDIRLGLFMGLALGWPDILTAIFLAYIIGSIIGIGLIISGRKKFGSQIPLGVFLTLALIIVLFWHDPLLDWYFGLFYLY